jgi:hypothetical protein
MKKKLILSVVSLVSLLGVAGCNNTSTSSSASDNVSSSNSVSSSSSSSSSAVTLSKLSITNKADLTSFFYTGDSNRSIALDIDGDKNATQLISDGVIKITSSNTAAVNVLGIYAVPVGVGAATITVTGGGLTDTVDVYVGNPTTIVPEDTEVGVGKTLAVSIDSAKNSTTLTDYNWSSSDEAVATVDANGVVTGVANGSVTITCSLKSNAKEGASVTLTVSDKVQTPVDINTVKKAGTYTVRGKVVAINTNSYILDDGTGSIMVYTSCKFSIGDIVKVSGSVIVYGTQKQPEFSGTFTETKVGGTVESMTAVDLTADILTKAKASTADTYYDYAKLYKWTATAGSSSSGYFVLNLDGCDDDVEPIKLDSKKFPYTEGHYYSVEGYWCGYNTSYKYHAFVITKLVEETPATTLVFTSEDSLQVDAKNTRKLSATYVLSEADKAVTSVTWSSSDEAVATVDQNGVVTGVAAGECDIIATVGGGSAKCHMTVIDEVTLSSIKDVDSKGKVYRVKGVITEVTSKGYIINDGTASIFVYMLNYSSLAYKKGDYIEVTSKTSMYDGSLMFENVTTNANNKSQYGVLDAEVYKLDDATTPDTSAFTSATKLTKDIADTLTVTTESNNVAAIKKYTFDAKVDGDYLDVEGIDGLKDFKFKYNNYTSSSVLSTLKDTYKYKIQGYYLGSTKNYKTFVVTSAVSIAETRIDPEKKNATLVKGTSEDISYTWSLADDVTTGTPSVSIDDDTVATVTINTGKKTVTINPLKSGTATVTLSIAGADGKALKNEDDEDITSTIAIEVVSGKAEITGTSLGLGKSAKDNATEATKTIDGIEYAYTAIGTDSSSNMILSSANKNTNSKTASVLKNNTEYSSAIKCINITLKSNSYANSDILKFDFGTDTDYASYSYSLSTQKNVVSYTITPDTETYKFFKVTFSDTKYNLYVTNISVLLA